MNNKSIEKIDFSALPSPCYIVDERLLRRNLEVLHSVQERTGCSILLAQKGFSMFAVYPLIGKYLKGVTSSSLFEARLGYEEMGKEVHIYAPAYVDEEFDEILKYCDHIVFNSFNQWNKFKDRVKKRNEENLREWEEKNGSGVELTGEGRSCENRGGEDCGRKEQSCEERGGDRGFECGIKGKHGAGRAEGKPRRIECGIRINPEYSEIKTPIYNPCYQYSRLGVTLANFKPEQLDGIDGLHFHTMCEQNSDTLERTIKVVDEKFGQYIKNMKWLNLGGGHHITRPDYDIETLVRSIGYLQDKYGVQVYLEPGEAVALNTGYLVATVLDIVENGMEIAILDASAECHMPDVLEMPYRPEILDAGKPGEYPYTYRFGGNTCLAGDIIGDYSFKKPLKPGDRVVFCDMAHYTMVKNNTFNGVNLPSIALYSESDGIRVIRRFGYEDFRNRLS